jgi:hypothetical protein
MSSRSSAVVRISSRLSLVRVDGATGSPPLRCTASVRPSACRRNSGSIRERRHGRAPEPFSVRSGHKWSQAWRPAWHP